MTTTITFKKLILTVGVYCIFVNANAAPLDDAKVAYSLGDYAQTIRLTKPLAEQGNAIAQTSLGFMFANGQGVIRDYQEAVKWYGLAAAQGLADAQFGIGVMYANGHGVKQDYQEAMRYFKLASAQGSASGQTYLGAMYASGQGVPKDYHEAVKWSRLAAAQGFPLGQSNLAISYATGQGVTKNDQEALRLFKLAAAQGDTTAIASLKRPEMVAAALEASMKKTQSIQNDRNGLIKDLDPLLTENNKHVLPYLPVDVITTPGASISCNENGRVTKDKSIDGKCINYKGMGLTKLTVLRIRYLHDGRVDRVYEYEKRGGREVLTPWVTFDSGNSNSFGPPLSVSHSASQQAIYNHNLDIEKTLANKLITDTPVSADVVDCSGLGFLAGLSCNASKSGSMLGAGSGILGTIAGVSGGPDARIKSFIDDSDTINKLLFSSLKAMERAYATDEERAKINEEMKAFNAITDPKERQAKVAETLKSESAKLEELIKSDGIDERTKNLDTERRKDLVAGTSNFVIAGLRAVTLAASGTSIVSAVASNPFFILKLGPLTTALPILSSAASTSASLLPQIFKVMRGANIQVQTVVADSKTHEVEF